LNAEVFTRCIDIVRDVALIFEADLAKLILELQGGGLMHLRKGVTAKQLAQALASGARGVNQRLPPVAPEDPTAHYHDMCRYILYGGTELPVARKRPKPARRQGETRRRRK
jgi:hypothetical protein